MVQFVFVFPSISAYSPSFLIKLRMKCVQKRLSTLKYYGDKAKLLIFRSPPQWQKAVADFYWNLLTWIPNTFKPAPSTSWHFLSPCAPRLVYTSSRWQWIVSSMLTCRSDKNNIPALTKTLESSNSQIHPLRQWQQWESHAVTQHISSSLTHDASYKHSSLTGFCKHRWCCNSSCNCRIPATDSITLYLSKWNTFLCVCVLINWP